MKEMIRWELLNNEETIIKKETEALINSLMISFDDEEGRQEIDLKNHIYNRITNDYKMIIDFNKKIGTFNFVTGEMCNIDIECNYIDNNKEIILKYNFDDDIKTLIIRRNDA